MDKDGLKTLYQEKLAELEEARGKLNEMYHEREAGQKPLTDPELLEQSGNCSELSLEISKLKEMLKETGD